ncbi:VOC family protein [Planococcus sp. CAU13]|uniref:VOC family protein n=1 Tax=Planococcus sp. CAU13 TaxID=1541197 RepID=UPI00052FFC65|nr:VOC family protein [Planococcus sp. CAU13]
MKFDHVIHFIGETPEQAVQFWRQKSRNAVIGGRHEKWGTRNALLYGKDSYIEWLALENREVAKGADHPLTKLLLHNGAGFGTVCFRTDDIAELEERLTAAGFQTSGVLDGSRRTAEGKLIEWKMLFIDEEPSARLPNPFFIQWDESDEQRCEGLRDSGAVTPESEDLLLERCIFGVEDTEEAEARWKQLLGGSLQLPNCLIEFRNLQGRQERLEEVHYKNGDQRIEFEKGVYFM